MTTMKDPVCGMDVTKASKFHADYKGQTYYFCSREDMQKFQAKPEQYVGRTGDNPPKPKA
jgi:Cu+-exporting ATPase